MTMLSIGASIFSMASPFVVIAFFV